MFHLSLGSKGKTILLSMADFMIADPQVNPGIPYGDGTRAQKNRLMLVVSQNNPSPLLSL
jgi:hypothetical protein